MSTCKRLSCFFMLRSQCHYASFKCCSNVNKSCNQACNQSHCFKVALLMGKKNMSKTFDQLENDLDWWFLNTFNILSTLLWLAMQTFHTPLQSSHQMPSFMYIFALFGIAFWFLPFNLCMMMVLRTISMKIK